MKTSMLFSLFVVGITCCASAQTSGGGGAASGSAAAPAPSGGAANPAASGGAANPVPSGSAANPAASGSAATPATGAMIQSNQVMTNQFGMNTNLQGSNNLSPTGAASGTNQMTDNDRDDAVTDNDRDILVTLRINVQRQLGVTSTGAMPVHFNINNGVVILIGFVPTADQSQRILLLAQQTPGVTQVDNRLRVGTPPSPLTPATTAASTPAFVGATTDRGFSPADRELLFKVQQAATKQLGRTPANGMQLPVHFSIENGVVSVMGQVFSQDKKQRLLAAVENTPGVVRVVDNVSVVAGAASPAPQ